MDVSLSCTFTTDELKTVLCAPLGDAVTPTFRTTHQIDDVRGDRFDLTATVSVPAGRQIAMAAQAIEQWDEPNGSITLRFDHDTLAEICSTLASRELRGRVPVMTASGDLEVGLRDPNHVIVDPLTGVVNTPDENLVLTLTLSIGTRPVLTHP